jgi:hypothetical protein
MLLPPYVIGLAWVYLGLFNWTYSLPAAVLVLSVVFDPSEPPFDPRNLLRPSRLQRRVRSDGNPGHALISLQPSGRGPVRGPSDA